MIPRLIDWLGYLFCVCLLLLLTTGAILLWVLLIDMAIHLLWP